jgi:hypothetical protein
MQSHPLDGDGISFEIFKYLSKVSRSAVNSGVAFRIPDTIVFANSCASFWYYYDLGSRSVARRPAKTLDRRHLFEFFSRKEKFERSDIVAQFTWWEEGSLRGNYLTKQGLHEFLFGPRKNHHGILQKFVEPREECNDQLQVAWSPEMSFAVRRVNGHRVVDRNVPPDRRCVTFDGACHDCEEMFCNATVRRLMGGMTRSLVEYFHEVDNKFEIGRFVGFFKQDAKDNVWFLYSTSIRVVEAASNDKRNTHAVVAEEITPRPALVPVLLTMSSLDDSKLAKLRRGGREVVAPPPRRLRGDFFTPAAPEDDDAIERAVEARCKKLQQKRVEHAAENERLFGVLAKLRREVGTLHATLDAGQSVQRARTATPAEHRRRFAATNDTRGHDSSPPNITMDGPTPPPNAPGRHLRSASTSLAASPVSHSPTLANGASRSYFGSASGFDGAATYGSVSRPGRGGRNGKSPRRRRSHVAPVPTVVARSMEVEAAAFESSAAATPKEFHSKALQLSAAIGDAFYPLGTLLADQRRGHLELRAGASLDGKRWNVVLPRWAWRFLRSRWLHVREFGVQLECPDDDLVDVYSDGHAETTLPAYTPAARHDDDEHAKDERVHCRVVEPYPSVGALQRFANKIQTMVLDDGCFAAEQIRRAAAAVKVLRTQELFDQLRQVTSESRMLLAAKHTVSTDPALRVSHADQRDRPAQQRTGPARQKSAGQTPPQSELEQDTQPGEQAVAADDRAALTPSATDDELPAHHFASDGLRASGGPKQESQERPRDELAAQSTEERRLSCVSADDQRADAAPGRSDVASSGPAADGADENPCDASPEGAQPVPAEEGAGASIEPSQPTTSVKITSPADGAAEPVYDGGRQDSLHGAGEAEHGSEDLTPNAPGGAHGDAQGSVADTPGDRTEAQAGPRTPVAVDHREEAPSAAPLEVQQPTPRDRNGDRRPSEAAAAQPDKLAPSAHGNRRSSAASTASSGNFELSSSGVDFQAKANAKPEASSSPSAATDVPAMTAQQQPPAVTKPSNMYPESEPTTSEADESFHIEDDTVPAASVAPAPVPPAAPTVTAAANPPPPSAEVIASAVVSAPADEASSPARGEAEEPDWLANGF